MLTMHCRLLGHADTSPLSCSLTRSCDQVLGLRVLHLLPHVVRHPAPDGYPQEAEVRGP